MLRSSTGTRAEFDALILICTSLPVNDGIGVSAEFGAQILLCVIANCSAPGPCDNAAASA